ncbi:PAS domain-containing protein [Sulfurimonas aquatica]|uniref:PAS domain-containing protein n=1 Tax=Sulfurimonas aquatica TaxID=2672570 RepID=A0A975AZK6_9BACT|nr:PAS domain-containing protein [Sulfurimonas aquatica]QSZ41474.1 PAS domain-containing protein [Sulfurimonas aquatica]
MNEVPFEAEIPQGKLILSRTDLKGIITYANETFAHVSGYQVAELIGKPHKIVRHPDMPRSIFHQMWDTLKSGQKWKGYVKNLRKDGGYYWVHASIVPLSEGGKIVGYKSSRAYVEPHKRQEIDKKYALIRAAEEGQISFTMSLSSSQWNKIKDKAETQGVTYQEVVKKLIDKM